MNESSSRREFLQASTAATAAATVAFPAILSAAPNSDKLRIGFIG